MVAVGFPSSAVYAVRACGDPGGAVNGTETNSNTIWTKCHSCGQPQGRCVSDTPCNACRLCMSVRVCDCVFSSVCYAAGLRFLPLRDISGHLIHQSGFFVLVHKTALKPSRRGGLVPRTTITSENGDLYTSQGVQNGDQSHDRSDLTSSANTHQKDRQKHFSRQDSIEEEPTSSQVVVVELH